ncbi:SCO2322 family protein [Longivirga aurantiaca]|uniref:SCO2322 family protein n=1 Tax=Longivirga aurantiaca TaxID=1837743 RepID=A0ABW1T465_9ACTN
MTAARRGTATARAVAVLGVLGSTLLALLVAAAVTAPAAEAASYRYWTYWWGQPGATSWTFAQLGPASDRPKDGAVIGWRFAVTTESGGKKSPRAALPFASLCPQLTSAPDGQKRVAVVVDYGSTSDAPPGEQPPGGGTVRVECVTAASNANAVTVLTTAGVSLRVGGNGLVCGIDGYPRTECAAVVADPTPTPTRTSAKPTPKPTTARPTSSSAEPATTAEVPAAPAGGTPTTPAGETTTPGASASSASASSTSAAPTAQETADGSEAPLPASSGAPVASGTEAPAGGSPLGPIAGAALVAVVGAGAWWTARGRRS